MSVQYGGDKITFADGSSTSSGYTFRNRIINGAMVVNQRALGTTTINSGSSYVYTVDRWSAIGEAALGVFTVQQSSSAPAGFTNSLLVTVTNAVTPGSGNIYVLRHAIEGYNVADLIWGTANAKTVTLSFWIYSSITGTFGGSIKNNAENRSYPFNYTVSSANTWTQCYVTIPGCPDGTWETTTSTGMFINFSIGTGSSYIATAGSWISANRFGATGQTNILATSGATWYITGVQLEIGSSATTFEFRPYGTELNMCQRYFQKVGGGTAQGGQSSTIIYWGCVLTVTMRTNPSLGQTAAQYFYKPGVDVWNQSSTGLTGSSSSPQGVYAGFTNISGVTTQAPYQWAVNYSGTPSYLTASAEL